MGTAAVVTSLYLGRGNEVGQEREEREERGKGGGGRKKKENVENVVDEGHEWQEGLYACLSQLSVNVLAYYPFLVSWRQAAGSRQPTK